jgi:RNA polymerase sigma factor (sigma-70 family)
MGNFPISGICHVPNAAQVFFPISEINFLPSLMHFYYTIFFSICIDCEVVPITNEELVRQIQSSPDLQGQYINQLWEQCEKFIKMQADKRIKSVSGLTLADVEDLYQVGYFALLEAIRSYTEIDGGRSFIGWLDYSLRTQFAEVLGYRTQKQKMAIERRAISIDGERESKKDGEKFSLEAFIPDPEQELELEEVLEQDRRDRLCKYVRDQVHRLPGDCQYIILEMLEHDLNVSATARRLEMERAKVQNIYSKGLNKLRVYVQKDRDLLRDMDVWQVKAWHGSGVEAWKRFNESSVERAVFLKEQMAIEMEYLEGRMAELQAERQRYKKATTSEEIYNHVLIQHNNLGGE